jgi:hypothetical protein
MYMIAVPATVGEDGVWLHFNCPDSGKSASLNLGPIIEKTGGMVSEILREWADAQMRGRAAHHPPTESA